MSQLARSKQSKKDEAIRKKAEIELNKKFPQGKRGSLLNYSENNSNQKNGPASGQRNQKRNLPQNSAVEYINGHYYLDGKRVQPGTVASLQPNTAFTVRETTTIVEAARLMAAKRADSVLVIDNEDRLSGIFTAKDIAFRAVAEGKNVHNTPVRDIATSDPLCVISDASAIDALNTMVLKGFRHLPICNHEGDVVGLLDVIKCMYDALDKMDRAYQSTRALYDALEDVEKEFSVQSDKIVNFVDNLKNKMNCPPVDVILRNNQPVIVTPKASVYEIAQLLKLSNTTAALIIDENQGLLVGIFTTKDIVLRVIAAGLDQYTTSVVRVMTSQPDTISPDTTIIDALKQMHEKNYLNLPVVNDEGEIIGIADVLTLCYSTLEQMKKIQTSVEGDANAGFNGPVWSQFFNGGLFDESQSSVSNNYVNDNALSTTHSSVLAPPMSFLNGTSHLAGDIFPNDSASMIDEITSAVNSRVGEKDTTKMTPSKKNFNNQQGNNQNSFGNGQSYHHDANAPYYFSHPDQMNSETMSGFGPQYSNLSNKENNYSIPFMSTVNSELVSNTHSNAFDYSNAHNIEENNPNNAMIFSFKFKTPKNNIHRFNLPIDNYDLLVSEVIERLISDGIKDAESLVHKSGLVYTDSENDQIQLNSQLDLFDAVDQAKNDGKDRVLINLNTISDIDTVNNSQAQSNSNGVIAHEQQHQGSKSPTPAIPQTSAKSEQQEKVLKTNNHNDTSPSFFSPTVIVGSVVASILILFIATRAAKK
ncbi:CBS domain-containing protein CBSCBSPB5 [Smittium culicis]|uniref:CBS domain-containing protein CBSCBSPB5 n=2 Tax=Smittium culicis TaxID=133412 RepID=A0A1R1Y217_9FUNG|nr:CBS domain-containing protein CBSCBSPB5 [Smittium culicis]